MIKDAYGTPQVYLVEPSDLDFELPRNDPVKTVMEGRFRTWYTCDEKGVRGGFKIQQNRQQAEWLAQRNGMRIITKEQQYQILESQPKKTWPEEEHKE